MNPLMQAFAVIWTSGRAALLRGLGLTCLVLAMGAALLGVSGWFITAAGAAGLAGVGIAFDVFRPSAAIRFLALGRAAARYGERLLSHDATLRALAALRVDVLRRHLALPFAAQSRLRIAPVLTRITADVDALDGLVLRLLLPGIGFVVIHGAITLVLGWLTSWTIALSVLVGQGLGGALLLARAARLSGAPAIHGERATQRLRSGLIEMLRAQVDAAVHGRLRLWRRRLLVQATRADRQLAVLDRVDRDAEAGLGLLATLAGAAALWAGQALVTEGQLSPAAAAIGIFVALAAQEAGLALRRGAIEFGRIRDAADRLFSHAPHSEAPTAALPQLGLACESPEARPLIAARALSFRRPGAARPVIENIDLSVSAGETLALTGPSGCGKSTILHLLAGLARPSGGGVLLGEEPLAQINETTLRRSLCLVPQRSALIAGSVLDNLALADPEITAQRAAAVLDTVCLLAPLQAREGVQTRLGEGGSGLSGGEARRLVLARAVLRRPRVLLLDEPTEGLDQATAARVLSGLRAALPEAAIVIAAHRPGEIAFADRRIRL